jgi:hypothetical protein
MKVRSVRGTDVRVSEVGFGLRMTPTGWRDDADPKLNGTMNVQKEGALREVAAN